MDWGLWLAGGIGFDPGFDGVDARKQAGAEVETPKQEIAALKGKAAGAEMAACNHPEPSNDPNHYRL
jgi:hypothetical protein